MIHSPLATWRSSIVPCHSQREGALLIMSEGVVSKAFRGTRKSSGSLCQLISNRLFPCSSGDLSIQGATFLCQKPVQTVPSVLRFALFGPLLGAFIYLSRKLVLKYATIRQNQGEQTSSPSCQIAASGTSATARNRILGLIDEQSDSVWQISASDIKYGTAIHLAFFSQTAKERKMGMHKLTGWGIQNGASIQ